MLVAFSSLCKFCKSAFPVRNFVQSFKLFFQKNSVSRWELLEEAKTTLALSLFCKQGITSIFFLLLLGGAVQKLARQGRVWTRRLSDEEHRQVASSKRYKLRSFGWAKPVNSNKRSHNLLLLHSVYTYREEKIPVQAFPFFVLCFPSAASLILR